MKIGSLFSGIGGLELGLEWSGIGETIWQCDMDERCLKVLAKHWPNVKRYKDVKTIGKHNLEPVDLICGGFPCQDVSAAGKGAGLSGSRSGLWVEFLRVVKELRPQWVVVENVASGAKLWVDNVSGDLEKQGYATFPVPLSAADCGAPHLRRRVFIVAHTNSQRSETGCESARREARANFDRRGKGSTLAHANEERRWKWSGSMQKQTGRGQSTDESSTFSDTNGEQAQRFTKPRSECCYWATEPSVGRVAARVPNRAHRLKQLGNAVVPQCAQVIGEFIKGFYA